MADVSKTVAIIFQGQDNASAVAGKLAGNLKQVEDSGGGASQKVDDLAKSTERLADTESGVATLTNAMRALAASLVFKAFVDANVEAEKFERSMTLLKGSTDAAASEFQYITGLAKTLGLNLFDAADAYISLTAATRGTALEGEQTREIFEAVSKAMSSLGKSSSDTEGALLAISQIVSKGTVSLEELRGQLGERLPGAFQIAAQSMGLTTQELDKLVSSGKLSAEEFLPKFAAALKDAFGDVSLVEGYAASMARLQNAVSEAFIEIGKAGTFELLTKGVEAATAAIVGAVSGFRLLGEIIGAVAGALATGSFTGLGEAIDAAFQKAGDSTRGARDALLGYTDEVTDAGTASATTSQKTQTLAAETAKSAEAQKAAKDAIDKAAESSKEQAKQLAKQAEETRKAEEAAQKFAIEMEKIASNERIKLIEARVALNVAQVEADTARIQAAFESINNTINSTGDVIGDALSALKDITPNTDAFDLIQSQLETENQLRREAFELQKQLTQAQIEQIRAQTQNLLKGDALIKIDGAGLQPHLEAFMWEIVKAVQVKANQDGLAFLLGVGA